VLEGIARPTLGLLEATRPWLLFFVFFGFAIFVGKTVLHRVSSLANKVFVILNVVFLVFGVHMRLHIVQNYFSKQQHEYNV